MAKLKTLRPQVATIKPLLGRDSGERARDKHREATQPWRRWYHSAEWKALRLQAFRRDKYRCQRTGELCIGRGQQPNAPVANHKVPHKGDRNLFFSLDNIETVTKAAHDGLIQREEKSGSLVGTGLDGRPSDPMHPWNRRSQ